MMLMLRTSRHSGDITPLALLGFMVAATYIDSIADALVNVLQFFGYLLAIPESVLGLTVLAWGNSIGDLSTNMAMAKKGLSNMAITACFAGPVFNMLVGIGAGFGLLLSEEGVESYPVSLQSGIIAGFGFLIVNCAAIIAFGVFNKHMVPKKYGFVSLAMYGLCLLVSFLLLFGAMG